MTEQSSTPTLPESERQKLERKIDSLERRIEAMEGTKVEATLRAELKALEDRLNAKPVVATPTPTEPPKVKSGSIFRDR